MKNILLISIATFGLTLASIAQNRHYVSATASGVNNGQSWGDAFTDLQAALSIAQAGDQIWVAQGTYLPTQTTDRSISFEPKSGVKLYGGFAGDETELSQRDWIGHPVFLSGDIGVSGDSADNSHNVVYLFQPDSSTFLDGFTICHGVADNFPASGNARDRLVCGGGLYVESANWDAFPSVQNCRFWRNTAYIYGGGVMLNGQSDGNMMPRFVNCRFEENHSLGNGGGLARFGGSWVERGVDFEDCSFSQNLAGQRGGGLYFLDSQGPNTISLQGCSFDHNTAVLFDGGGAHFGTGKSGKSGLHIRSTVFEGNKAAKGAAINLFTNGSYFDGDMMIDSCAFVKNVSLGSSSSSTVYADQFGTPQSVVTLSNSKFDENFSQATMLLLAWLDVKVIIDNTLIAKNSGGRLVNLSETSRSEIRKTTFRSNEVVRIGTLSFNGNGSLLKFSNCFFDYNKTNDHLFFVSYVKNIQLVNCTSVKNINNYPFISNSESNDTVIYSNVSILDESSNTFFYSYSSYCYVSFSYLKNFDCSNLPPYIHCGPGNLIGSDPMFRDPDNGDYSLLPCSPLINAGSNAAAMGILTDIAGNPRIQGGTVDIGAYESPAFALAASPQVQPACVGSSNGSIAITPVFGCEPYTYNWLPDAGNGPQLNGLLPGNYLLTITDGSGRQIRDTVQVASAPLPVLNPVVTDVQCGTTLGGSIAANVSNGTAPYHYEWLPAGMPDTSYLSQLSPLTYHVSVTDANGCQDSASANISLLGLLTLMVDGQGISCFGETDGWLSATPLTGASPFFWDWQGWAGTDSVAQPLGPGMYAVTVSDVFGCTAAFTFPPMNQPDSLYATVGTQDQTNLSMPNGAAVVTTISGGMAPYGFDWSTGSTQQAIAGLTAGDYIVTVTDKNGCEVVVEVVVELMVSSTEALEGQAFVIYPNPVADWLKVVLPTSLDLAGDWQLQLANAAGQVVRSETLSFGAEVGTLNLQGLPAGAYWLTATKNSGLGAFKVKVLKH